MPNCTAFLFTTWVRMKSLEALEWGYCPRCATFGAPNRCGIWEIGPGVECRIDPHYGEWLRVNFGLKGPRLAEDLGIFEGLKPRGK